MTGRQLRVLAPVVAALVVGIALIALVAGIDSAAAAPGVFVDGVAGSETALGATMATVTPILLCGLAAFVSFRAGIFNLGQPGQLVAGALLAGAAGPYIPGPAVFQVVVILVIGALGGALWAAAAGAAMAYGLDVIIVSLLLNFAAGGVASLVSGRILNDPEARGIFATRRIDAALPTLVERTNLHGGVLIALAVAAVATVVLKRSVVGHRLALFGQNPVFAAYSGTRRSVYEVRVVIAGGLMCGLAGGIQVLGVFHRYVDGALGGDTSPGWTGIILALLVGTSIVAIIPAGFLLGALTTGMAAIERTLGISSRLGMVLQAVILIGVATLRKWPSVPEPPPVQKTRADSSHPPPREAQQK